MAVCVQMLEQGPAVHHRAVLRLLYEYLRLQEPLAHGMHALVNSTMVVVHRHLHGPLWREAVDLLKLAVSSSAALVQPPTRGLPVDLGLFNQTLPGPTLQFSMDLQVRAHQLYIVCSVMHTLMCSAAKLQRPRSGAGVTGAVILEEPSW